MDLNNISSLIEFQMRVLHQGRTYESYHYKLSELKQKLFFNSVFISNTNEMYDKYDMHSCDEILKSMMHSYTCNVKNIFNNMCDIFHIRAQCKLQNNELIQLINKNIQITIFSLPCKINYKFQHGKMYIVCVCKSALVIIEINNKSDIIQAYIDQFKNHKEVYQFELSILNYIKDLYNPKYACLFQLTIPIENDVHANYIGDKCVLNTLFKHKILLIHNQYMNIKYIDKIFELTDTNEIQQFKSFDLDYAFKHDMLVEYPSDSFTSYLDFLDAVVKYPGTTHLYLTLYRIGTNTRIFDIMRRAVANHIKVHMNIELCAYGEYINEIWMHLFKSIGIDVYTYACNKLKVHSKITLIKFIDHKPLAQIGTGNYHTQTTSQYTDLSLITSNDTICNDVENVFKLLMNKKYKSFSDHVLVTRHNFRNKIIQLIYDESMKYYNGFIFIKCNALNDQNIIDALQYAAECGCNIYLLIRGICLFRSNKLNVHISSVLWDKLEHSRVYVFGKNIEHAYIGSLDLTSNKIDKRIEVMGEIIDVNIMYQITKYINRYLNMITGKWNINNIGMYSKSEVQRV